MYVLPLFFIFRTLVLFCLGLFVPLHFIYLVLKYLYEAIGNEELS